MMRQLTAQHKVTTTLRFIARMLGLGLE
jgi:hypothetical protein